MSIELKIKTKHLSSESKIIRKEELKLKKQIRSTNKYAKDGEFTEEQMKVFRQKARDRISQLQNIQTHRVNKLRGEARCTHLAYGFVKGVPYRAMEDKETTKSEPNWSNVQRMVERYSDEDSRVILQRFAEWKSDN